MTGADVLDVARDALITTLIVAAPAMLVGLAVGVFVSLIQALTQIQEQTLAFIPKILSIFAVLILVLPFMGDAINAFMGRIVTRIIAAGSPD